MHVKLRSWAGFIVALAIPLALGVAVAGPANGDEQLSGQATIEQISAPRADDDLHSWLHRSMGLTGEPAGKCFEGYAFQPGKTSGTKIGVPCTATFKLKGIPAKVSPGFKTQPGTDLAALVAGKTGMSLDQAQSAVAQGAGIKVSQLATMTSGEVLRAMTTKVVGKTTPDAVFSTRVCASQGGHQQCGQASGAVEGIFWGSVIGGAVGGAAGAGLGAIIGGIIGGLWDWLTG